jgi:hypothetical protein
MRKVDMYQADEVNRTARRTTQQLLWHQHTPGPADTAQRPQTGL